MKTLSILLSTAGLAGAGALALSALPAEAATAASCSGARSIASAPMLRNHQPPSWGTVRLVRDSCYQYWAEITMASPLLSQLSTRPLLPPPYCTRKALAFALATSGDAMVISAQY